MTEVDFITFMRILDSVSRISDIHCTCTLSSIDFCTFSEVDGKFVRFACITSTCTFLVANALEDVDKDV